MEESKMQKIIRDLKRDVDDLYFAWDKGDLKSVEAIITIKNIVKYLISEFLKQR